MARWQHVVCRSRSPRVVQPKTGNVGEVMSASDLPIGHTAPSQSTTGHIASRELVTLGLGRSGRYTVTDAAGHRIGTVFGDYVIGFTIMCWDLKWTVTDLDDARITIQNEAEARALDPGLAAA